MTQNDMIIHHIRKSFLTPLDALRLYGIMNFSGRISEIRKHYELREMWINLKSNKRVKAFKIKGIK